MLAHPGFWSVVQQLGRKVVAYGIFLLLGALLAPGDFGIVALASTAIALMTIFADLGFVAALVQREELTADHINAVFALNVAASAVLAGVGVLLSWPLAAIYKTPTLQPVLIALSLGFFINGLGQTQMALAQRSLRFRDLALRDLTGTMAGGVVAVAMALRGFGVWSLVAQALVTAVVGTALLWRLSPWRPTWHRVPLAGLRDLWGYSSGVMVFSILKFFTQNSDTLLVGLLTGPVLLGYYNFGSKVTIAPITVLAGAVGSYLFASLARLQSDRQRLRDSYLRYSEAMLTVALPALTVMALIGPLVLPAILGDRWRPIGPLIPPFSAAAAVLVLISPVGNLLKAVGRVGWLTAWSAMFTTAVLALVALGSRWGVLGVAIGYTVAHLLAGTVAVSMLQRSIGVRGPQVLRTMRTGVALSALIAASIVLARIVPGIATPGRVALGLLASGASLSLYARYIGVGEVGRAIERWRQEASA